MVLSISGDSMITKLLTQEEVNKIKDTLFDSNLSNVTFQDINGRVVINAVSNVKGCFVLDPAVFRCFNEDKAIKNIAVFIKDTIKANI
jgi:hypothetical protein